MTTAVPNLLTHSEISAEERRSRYTRYKYRITTRDIAKKLHQFLRRVQTPSTNLPRWEPGERGEQQKGQGMLEGMLAGRNSWGYPMRGCSTAAPSPSVPSPHPHPPRSHFHPHPPRPHLPVSITHNPIAPSPIAPGPHSGSLRAPPPTSSPLPGEPLWGSRPPPVPALRRPYPLREGSARPGGTARSPPLRRALPSLCRRQRGRPRSAPPCAPRTAASSSSSSPSAAPRPG